MEVDTGSSGSLCTPHHNKHAAHAFLTSFRWEVHWYHAAKEDQHCTDNHAAANSATPLQFEVFKNMTQLCARQSQVV
jgi:hypothetical protein